MAERVELWQTDGEFWTDDEAVSAVPGTLTVYDDGRSKLKLYDSLPGHEHDFLRNERRSISHIKGHTRKYGQIILLDPMQTNLNFTSRGLRQVTYVSRRLICSGDLSHEWHNAYALELHANLRGLETWLGVSGFQVEQDFTAYSLRVSYVLPSIDAVQYSDVFASGFAFNAKGPTRTNPQLEVLLRQEVRLSVRSATPVPLERLATEVQNLADLINLGMGIASVPVFESVLFAVPTTCLSGSWAELYFYRNRPNEADIPHPTEMIFNYPSISARWMRMVSTWSRSITSIRSTYELYFATVRSSGMYTEHRLFNYFQALEAFHRVKYNRNTKVLLKDPKRGPAAGERVADLVERFGGEWIFPSPWRDWVDTIANVRNYLVHRERKPADEHLTSLAILNFGSRLQMLCELCLLTQAGFSDIEARTALQSIAREQKLIYS